MVPATSTFLDKHDGRRLCSDLDAKALLLESEFVRWSVKSCCGESFPPPPLGPCQLMSSDVTLKGHPGLRLEEMSPFRAQLDL